ncbi:MAG: T9SS type A sorting domain-containing protein [Mangrovibacterium sp.]
MKKLFLLWVSLSTFLGVSYGQDSNGRLLPGGVSGVKVWFETEQVPNRGNYSRWVDKSGHGLILQRGTSGEYEELDKEHNFHMSLWFHRDDVFFNLPASSGRQLTTFGIFNPYQSSSSQSSEYLLYDAVSLGGDQSFNMTTDKLYTSGGAVRLDYGSEQGEDLWYRSADYSADNYSKYSTTKLLTHYKSVVPNHSLWGENEELRFEINKNRSGMNKIWWFIPEFIVYDRHLRLQERLRVESYMARKYALPLTCSYLSASGDIMWDYSENQHFNNRLVYVGREDASDLYQPRAVSSYERYVFNNIEGNEGEYETGYGSTTDNGHWNNRDRNRLLIFGVQELDSASYAQHGDYAGLADNDYYMFGDDDGNLALEQQENKGLPGMQLSGRRWTMQTNVSARPQSLVSWASASGIQVQRKNNHQQLRLLASGLGEEVNISTQNSATHGSPSLSFELGFVSREHGGEVRLGFSSSPSGTIDYGFLIQENGYVYTLEDGVRRTSIDTYTTTRHRKFTVKLEGSDLVFYYRYHLSGTAYPLSRRITLSEEQIAQLQYAQVAYQGTLSEDIALLSKLETEGFVSNDSPRTRLELRGAYNQTASRDYNGMVGLPNIDASDNKTVWLVVDPTGSGDFSNPQVLFYAADETTGYGVGKYLFDDVSWSGHDVFTFGFSEGSIVAQVESFPYECDNFGELTQEGYLSVLLQQGDSIYHDLQVFNAEDSLVYSGDVFLGEEDKIHLPAGDYRVDISHPETREVLSEEVSIWDDCEGFEEEEEPEEDQSTTSPSMKVELKAYPNPVVAGTEVRVTAELKEPTSVVYLISDINGRVLGYIERSEQLKVHELRHAFPNQGVYVVKVISGNAEEGSVKFVVR